METGQIVTNSIPIGENSANDGGPSRVLIVDDNPVVLEILNGICEKDFIVKCASSGEEALEIIPSFMPDAVVLDVIMPGINGYEVCKRMRSDPATQFIKVIIVSGEAIKTEDRKKGYAAGACDYIVKPFVAEDLHAKLHVCTRLMKTEEQLRMKIAEMESARLDLQKAKDALEETVSRQTKELLLNNETIKSETEKRINHEQEKESLKAQVFHLQKVEAIGKLAGGVAHDFNNMLCGVIGNAELLKNKIVSNPGLLLYVERILDTSKRGSDLTKQLLAFVRKNNIARVQVNLHEIIGQIIGLLEHTIDKRISIKKRLEAQPDTINGDATHLGNILLNLALNARDAMPDGGDLIFETEVVNLNTEYCESLPYKCLPGRYVMLSVRDTGTGMDKETQRRMFEPFFTTKEAGRGTGLGLASVYSSVKQHDGCINVYSEPGHGSIFKISLPLLEKEEPPRAQPKTRREIKGFGSILFVDDDETIRQMGQELFSLFGYTVHSCRDGEEAVKYFEKNHGSVDIVILDIVMPKMSGHECFLHMKQIDPTVAVIVTSGYGIDGEAQRILDDGAKAFLQKPFTSDRLAKVFGVLKDGLNSSNAGKQI